jgi:lysozyme
MDNKILPQLGRHEGRPMKDGRAFAYQDSVGFWTIGTGRLIDKRKGGGLTDVECDFLLSNDVKRFEKELDVSLPWWRSIDPVRQRVLLDMAFNLGTNGLLSFANTLKFIKDKDYIRAADNMLKSKWAEQVGKRALTLSEMIRTGKDPDWLK